MKKLLKSLTVIVIALSLVILSSAPLAQARGRIGSHRFGGWNSHGKGSHYYGGW